MSKSIISTGKAPAAIGPYSQAVEAGGFIFISGQLPADPATGTLTEADTAKQTETVIKNLEGILTAAGLTLNNVVKTTVFMTDLSKFSEMNGVYARHFKDAPPARATVEVRALPKGALVEIEAVAAR